MKRAFIAIALAACWLAGCATAPKGLLIQDTLGPEPGPVSASDRSALRVYSATEQHQSGTGTFYYPHTGYLIYDAQGKEVQYVVNHVGDTDQSPSQVYLPSGHYLIEARAEGYGRLRIPVVIITRHVTVVHLEQGWKPPLDTAPASLARMPDGQPIGWRCTEEPATKPVRTK